MRPVQPTLLHMNYMKFTAAVQLGGSCCCIVSPNNPSACFPRITESESVENAAAAAAVVETSDWSHAAVKDYHI